jgi:hypothetical protein
MAKTSKPSEDEIKKLREVKEKAIKSGETIKK